MSDRPLLRDSSSLSTWLIAANVLHATADLRQTLTHVRELLAPGGELILLESTQPLAWLDLIFGLTEGWWKFSDSRFASRLSLLPAEEWQKLLQGKRVLTPKFSNLSVGWVKRRVTQQKPIRN